MLTGIGTISKLNYTRRNCAITCFQSTTCLSFNYHVQTQECQFNTDSPYTKPLDVLEAPGWALYHLQRDTDWELVFRAQANNSLSPYQTWMGNSSPPNPVEDGCRLMTGTSTCTSIYRSDVLTTWDSESISEVQLHMYHKGRRVVYIRFNGTGSTLTNWFSVDRLIDSGWSTMSQSRTFNSFSLKAGSERRFFINQNYGGCPYDVGWMVVIDIDTNIKPCVWDSMSNRPVFLFAPGEDVTRWIDFVHREADVLAVFIKR
ncbi:uncharacterized protein LOC117342936 [Pecten maximus]|uniref:uncharacterized protein LOC117342936 n=1 Tax=Pecten maximus TaxID=6579 RepID=UPI001458B961|nr:uncharacterized protein LOC117342936 [Pecten maximus]